MTIQSEIDRINTNIENAYTVCNNKGATMPQTQNSENLADCIDSITVTANNDIPRVIVNGIYQIPTLGSSNFALPSSANDLGDNVLGCAYSGSQTLVSVDLSNLTSISGANSLYRTFKDCPNLTSVDLSNLTTVSGNSALYMAFSDCPKLTTVKLNNLVTISGESALTYFFRYCTGLTTVDLSGVTSITKTNALQGTFMGCTNLTSVNFNSLQQIGLNTIAGSYAQFTTAFAGCDKLTSVSFPNLEKIYCTGSATASRGTFYNCAKVQKFYFPKLDTITYGSNATATNRYSYKYIFSNCSELEEIHFGSANQSAIESNDGYSTLWGRGAGNATVYFDL